MAVTKDRIADVFERHVERFGYRKTTLDEVAHDLGISKKTLYVHFVGKREIYAYVVERMAAASRREMTAGIGALPTCGEKVTALFAMVLQMSRAHIVETAEADWRQEYEVAADAFTEATGSLIQELVEGGIRAGEFAVTDAQVVRRLFTGMVLEYVLMVRGDPSLDVDAELTHAFRRFLG